MKKKKEITNKTPIDSIVTLPKHFTYGGRLFIVNNWFKSRGYRLTFISGKDKGIPIEWFDEKELIVINEKDITELTKE